MAKEFIYNGAASGDVASVLLSNGFDTNGLRPFIGRNGRSYITVNVNGKLKAIPLNNAVASLRSDDWKLLDDAVVKAAKERLRAVADIRGLGLTFNIPNGMGKTILETETQSDINDADIAMDPTREGKDDRPEFELGSLPLPIIYKDFHYTARQIAVSRNGGSPLDTTTAELAARRVAEEAEKLLLGVATSYTYGGGTVYGYTNFPSRLTATITSPESVGWVGTTLLTEILAMRKQSVDAFHYGPWMMYVGPGWDQYLDADFKAALGTTTRERLQKINGITDIRTLDYLTGFDILLVQMTSDVVREVIGMDITTLQWDTQGGLKKHFKVMAIMVPQLRADFNSNTGIVHGSV